jgi:hypothetical protein
MADYFASIDKNIKELVRSIKANNEFTEKQTKTLDKYTESAEKKADRGLKGRAALEKQLVATEKYLMAAHSLLESGARGMDKKVIQELGFSKFETNMMVWGDTIREWKDSIKGWVKERIQNWKDSSKLYQIGKRFWEHEATVKFMQGMLRFAQGVGRHVREVLGPFNEVIDFVKDAFTTAFNLVKGAVTSVWDVMTMRRKEDREKRMAKNIGKMREGIEYLVKGEKVSAISDPAKKKSIFGKIGNLLGLGAGGGLFGGLVRGIGGGLGSLLIKFGVIGMLGYMIGSAVKKWIEVLKGGGGAGEAAIEGAVALTSLPRKILGWIGDALFEWLGINFKPSEYLTDDAFRNAINYINDGVQKFIDTIINFWYKVTDKFYEGVDWVLEKLGIETAGVSIRKTKEMAEMVKAGGIATEGQAQSIAQHREAMKTRLRELYAKGGPKAEREAEELRKALHSLDWAIKDLSKSQKETYDNALKAAAAAMADTGVSRNDVLGQEIPESMWDPAMQQNMSMMEIQGD